MSSILTCVRTGDTILDSQQNTHPGRGHYGIAET